MGVSWMFASVFPAWRGLESKVTNLSKYQVPSSDNFFSLTAGVP